MADIFGGFSCIRFAGYLELRGVPPITRGTPYYAGYPYLHGVPLFVWGTSYYMGYLYLCGIPLIVQGTSIYTGYLKSCRAPRIMQGTSDCAEIIPLADTWRSITFLIFPQTTSP